jgi:hypothetical protein
MFLFEAKAGLVVRGIGDICEALGQPEDKQHTPAQSHTIEESWLNLSVVEDGVSSESESQQAVW